MSKLRDQRESAGYTREELAREAKTSTSTITRMEREDHIPAALTVARIAQVLNVPTDYLLTLTTPVPDAPQPGTGVPFSSDGAA